MTDEVREHVEGTQKSLLRIHDLDSRSIGRRDKLGDLHFEDGIMPLERTVALFREISPEILSDLSQNRRDAVRQQADALHNQVEEIRSFTVASPNPMQARDAMVRNLINSYDNCFESLWPAIAYSVRRATDFSRMEREARATIQAISDRTHAIEVALRARQEEADKAIEAIRKVAAEQGVSQQAIYFKEEAELHGQEADSWLLRTKWLVAALGLYGVVTFFLHKIPAIAPSTTAEAIQFGISKMLVFASIAYFLVLSARNFMAHRHNAVVNKHRQNALVTYRAIVEAAGDAANRDVVLAKAAESIFGAQSTAFAKHDSEEGKALSMVSIGAGTLREAGGA